MDNPKKAFDPRSFWFYVSYLFYDWKKTAGFMSD